MADSKNTNAVSLNKEKESQKIKNFDGRIRWYPKLLNVYGL